MLALLRSHLLQDPAYLMVVRSYLKVHWKTKLSPTHVCGHWVAQRVGGHTRRAPHAKRSIDALACVCKLPPMAGATDGPPVGRKRNR